MMADFCLTIVYGLLQYEVIVGLPRRHPHRRQA